MGGFNNPLVTKGGGLVYPSIHSPNFSQGPPIVGWSIDKNGNAFFSGTIGGTNFEITSQGAFFYSGTPATGNLIASITSGPGTDQFGNTFFGGVCVYDSSGNVVELAAGSLFTFNESTGVFTNLVKGVLLVYKGGGGLGNLIASIAPASGTDQYGNAYPQGMNVTQGQISGSTFSGTDFILNTLGAFFYSGTPAAGNLILSIASAASSDSFGNAYPEGLGLEFPAPASGFTTTSQAATFQDSNGNIVGQLVAKEINAGIGGGTTYELDILGSNAGSTADQPGIALSTLIGVAGPLGKGVLKVISGVTETDALIWNSAAVQAVLPLLLSEQAAPSAIPNGPQLYGGSDGQPAYVNPQGLQQQISGSKLASANTANVTTTALTSLGFMTVPASDVETGASYQVHASGSFSTGNSVPTSATFKVFWGGTGGTVIATLAIPGTLAANLSGAGWFADAEINWLSTSEAAVTLRVGWHTGSGVAGSVVYFAIADTTGLTTGSNQNLSLGFQWGSAPGGQQLLCDICRLGRVA